MPVRSGSARRYAAALFSLAIEKGTVDAWAAELGGVAHIVSEPGALRALTTPSVSLAAKRTTIEAISGKLSNEVSFVVNMLLERKRIDIAPDLAEAFAELVRQQRGIELAEVTSAVVLDDEERRMVQQRLESYLGRRVELTMRVDPSIIGGVVVRVGDQLFDASVRARLEALRRRLTRGSNGAGSQTAALEAH